MRKQILMLSMAVASVSFAQTASQSKVSTRQVDNRGTESIDPAKLSKTSQINNEWYSYVSAYEAYYGQNNASLNANNLFPDTTVLVNYSSGYSGPWIHNTAILMDLKAATFKNTLDPSKNFSVDHDFTVDSLSTTGIYTRVSGSAVVDTLVINLYEPSASQIGSQSYFYNSPVTQNLNPGDTVFLTNFDWDFATVSTPGSVKEIRILMDDNFANDTTDNGFHQIDEFVGQTFQNANGTFAGFLGITVEFRPGYTWTANIDTLGVNVNSWRFFSWELNGDDTYPFYDKADYNLSYILPTDVRFNNAGGWNGSFIPSYAYMGSASSYAYEAHEMNVKVTQDVNVGIEELSKINFNVYPNPSNGAVNVKFGDVSNGVYNVRLVNIVGQEVFSKNIEVSANAVESFNFEGMDKGIYLLNISGNGMNSVQKVTLR